LFAAFVLAGVFPSTGALVPAARPAALLAHHSYLMFDGATRRTVTGTVAKIEWMNPHVYLWVYVANASTPTGYDVYAFENGSINVLSRLGWTKTAFAAGDKVAIEFFPLKDGRTGGHLIQVKSSGGRVLKGAGGPGAGRVVAKEDQVAQ
jgi:hypothetical protein